MELPKINRDVYLNKLISRKNNGAIKVITGLRRCGKSYLLFELYYEYLLQNGVKNDEIIKVSLESDEFEELTDYKKLGAYLREKTETSDEKQFYIFLDEVQFCPNFEKVLNGLSKNLNLDIYVTGSNSKFLSSDILTEFRGRGDEIRIFPLSFKEFSSAFKGSENEAWKKYSMFGGLPRTLYYETDEDKSAYLLNLFSETYLKDIEERNSLRGDNVLKTVLEILSSSIGSLTNPTKIANTFNSVIKANISDNTIRSYIEHIKNAFLLSESKRYDVKGREYIGSNSKFYFTDVGLRNALLNFRQIEMPHIMENIIYNELLIRGWNVDVGEVALLEKNDDGKYSTKKTEIDFVCNKGSKRIYIQSAYQIENQEKLAQEIRPFLKTKDNFEKILVVKDDINSYSTDDGIKVVGLFEFLQWE